MKFELHLLYFNYIFISKVKLKDQILKEKIETITFILKKKL